MYKDIVKNYQLFVEIERIKRETFREKKWNEKTTNIKKLITLTWIESTRFYQLWDKNKFLIVCQIIEYIFLPLSVSGGIGVLRYGYPLLYSYSRPRSSGQQSTGIQSLSQHSDFIIPISL